MSTGLTVGQNENVHVQTFVFYQSEDMATEAPTIRNKIWQIFPAVIASLLCIPYGLMLGWPSPTYPKLLDELSPIPINIDQSAMIAGFLMIGNIFGTPISSWSFVGSKYGIILGVGYMLVGWFVMWFASNIYFLLGSRILVGLGNGYALGQLKSYIRDLCEPNLGQILLKLINFYVYFGVILAYILGYFTSFTDFSLAAIIVTAVVFILCFLLPHTPKEYVRFGKMQKARRILQFLKPNLNSDREIQQLEIMLDLPMKELSIFQLLRNKKLRRYFGIIGLLTFFMQFSGAPATIIYTQIILTASHCPFPKLYAISYVGVFFVSNFLGIFYFARFNRKIMLLFSSFATTLALALNICVFYMDLTQKYWLYASLISLYIFIFLHSIGLAVVPFMLTQHYFPPNAVKVVTHFQIMQHSALALIITKIFQVLYDQFELYVPFCLFMCVSFVSIFFVLIFVPYNIPVLSNDKEILKKTQF